MSASVERIKEIEMLLSRSNIIDKVTLNTREFTKEEIGDFCAKYGLTWDVGEHGDWVWMQFHKDGKFMTGEDFALLGFKPPPAIPKPNQISTAVDVPFGWLSPLGDFIEADFAEHEKMAGDIVDCKGWEDEYYDWSKQQQGAHLRGDYLVAVKGYALLHNPMLGGLGNAFVTHQKPLTKKQKEKLFDFYMKAETPELARKYFE